MPHVVHNPSQHMMLTNLHCAVVTLTSCRGYLVDTFMAPFHPGLAALTKRILKVRDVRLMPFALQLLADPVLAPAAARAHVAFEEACPAYQAQHHAAFFAGLELKALLSDALEALDNQPATAVLPRSFSELIWQMQERYAAAAAAAAAAGTLLPEPSAAQCGLPEGWSVELVELALATTAARNGHSPCTFNHTHLEEAEQELYALQKRLQRQAAACSGSSGSSGSNGSNKGVTAGSTGTQKPKVAGSSSKVSGSNINNSSGNNSGSSGSKAAEQARVRSSCLGTPSTPPAAVIAGRSWCDDIEHSCSKLQTQQQQQRRGRQRQRQRQPQCARPAGRQLRQRQQQTSSPGCRQQHQQQRNHQQRPAAAHGR